MIRRRTQLAEAHAANRDLRNKLFQIEQPLRDRIRELEAERDKAVALARRYETEATLYRKAAAGNAGLIYHLLSTEKTR